MFLFCLLLVLVSSKRLNTTLSIDSPCLTDLRAESLKYIGKKGPAGRKAFIYKRCYENVPDKDYRLISLSTHSGCYISHQSFYQVVGNISIPRCGSCMEIIGPSLKSATCTVIGSFAMIFDDNATKVADYNSYVRTFFVDDQLYQYYSGLKNEDTLGDAIPVVSRTVDCPYKAFPSAIITDFVTDPTTQIQYAHFMLYNTNQVIAKIMLNNWNFFINDTTMKYTIPVIKSDTKLYLKIYDLFYGHFNIQFSYIQGVDFVSNSMTQNHFKIQNCYLRLNKGFRYKV
ncbi:hypothetical protein EIN_182800, partial [Entamoeba invadens IP1]|uniref:hypothetical protein n=1 Tax=Entamoeba invadens IP1 TaxID=370355 RepID=UPI0002C3D999